MKYVQSEMRSVAIGEKVFDDEVDGYISRVTVGGKTYKLRCEVIEVYDMTCPKCGSPLQLSYGNGKCEYCGTCYTTQFKLVER